MLQHAATCCNTLQHAATRCHTPQRAATHAATQTATQHARAASAAIKFKAEVLSHDNKLQHSAIHCNTLQHALQHTSQRTGSRCGDQVQIEVDSAGRASPTPPESTNTFAHTAPSHSPAT